MHMFPLRDENPTTNVTWMTWLLIAVNVAMFAYETWLVVAIGGPAYESFVLANAFVPARFFASPLAPREWVTIITAMFMHAGWLHIGGNMLYLWIFGNNIEDRLGPWRFLGFYVLCGIAATALQAGVAPGLAVPMLGASGAVAGVLAAYLLLYPRARVVTAVFIFFIIELAALPAWLIIAVWFVIQLASGLGSLGQTTAIGGVAYFAHIGGFVTGIVLALPSWIEDRRKPTRFVGWS
jgi:membrane associated rhomboid family serine protease